MENGNCFQITIRKAIKARDAREAARKAWWAEMAKNKR